MTKDAGLGGVADNWANGQSYSLGFPDATYVSGGPSAADATGSVMVGSVIGRRISGASLPVWEGQPCCNQKAPTLHFDRAMTTRPICTYGRFSIRRGTWREILP